MQPDHPILEFDPTTEAVINPSGYLSPIKDIPEHAVLCFFQEVITNVVQSHSAEVLHKLVSEIGPNPVYTLSFNDRKLVVVHPGVGAPLAAAFLEELIALGCRKFIACGSCGVLDSSIAAGHILVPTNAVRDEGTSYHYLPPTREVAAHPTAVAAILSTLAEHHCSYLPTKTWTTDAIYRETFAKVQWRKAEGCLAVEMEAAAFFAVAQFRGVPFAQILYAGDDVGAEQWDSRGWNDRTPVREKLFWLAAEACLKL